MGLNRSFSSYVLKRCFCSSKRVIFSQSLLSNSHNLNLVRNGVKGNIISNNNNHLIYEDKRFSLSRLEILKNERIKPFSEFLTDNYNRKHDYLRISITERCNLRCTYCMPEDGIELTPNEKLLTTEEILRIVRIFISQGVTKVRLTGGEPTVRKDVVELVKRLNELEGLKEICMTSNGIALHRKLPELFASGLTSLNLSLDTLIEGKFLLITRRNGLNAVMKSLNKALELNLPKIKLNVVIMKNINEDEILNFVELTKNAKVDVRFIEYMPFEGNKWRNSKMVKYEDMLNNIKVVHPDIYRLDHNHGDTSKNFQIPNYKGKIGFITSMTENFCSTCTRLRITNDGNLKVCLFGNNEVSLRDLLRQGKNDDEILQHIGKAVKSKKAKHAGIGELENLPNRPMILIDDFYNKFHNGIWLKKTQFSNIRRMFSTFARNLNNDDSKLTHVDASGNANMVDIHNKEISHRIARASGTIVFSNDLPITLIRANSIKKGDVISIARVSGIMAAKKTSELIPLCHPIMITKVKVDFTIGDNKIDVICSVECDGKTGVEMEALTGLNVALLTIYDMCKAVDKEMVIGNVKIIHKSGGKSGEFNL
ncbi:hypothetical protein PACTADRAFT_57125 [Pachysolen tannophilus NRRL Y-2460]|uniref:Radical SAM core domain-containing protein n=1 Tax=Pachysolen tannophilus NRRL Y-2460 TaxID=669874 RepID=A0A1E4TX21_PACTA|nr:hypothetical protein PACTADRAFT_57125 [Pachysolen tannophilus NRRL Y-2460]